LDGHLARPGRVPGQVPGDHRGTHLSAVVVPLAVRAGLRVERAGYCNSTSQFGQSGLALSGRLD
jgi:hypothetical protein